MAQVNLDTAARLDIICRKGDSFELNVEFGVDFTALGNSGFKMEVRSSDTASAVTYSSSASPADFTIERVDDEAGGSETYLKGKLKISAPNNAIDTSGLFVYDLQHTDNNVTKTYLFGTFKVNEDITV
tara:strand:- start:345 stop:728 length:384 start_codon:yes stop_codon:yes gene_type:complete